MKISANVKQIWIQEFINTNQVGIKTNYCSNVVTKATTAGKKKSAATLSAVRVDFTLLCAFI
ncbi:MAG: hypothetical protein GY777_31675 [Candidatus Brocadiaceae bacterium]|nr:hypothetical protein [Candidatus Brocadiaceae bacterium]